VSEVEFVSLGVDDYDRAKTVLNRAKHPSFVGRELYYRCATAGTCTIAVLDGVDVGVALVTKDKLQAMSVITAAQGRGVGAQLLARVKPRWVNAIAEKAPWFEARGYRRVGEARASANGKHAQLLLERTDAADSLAPTTVADRPPPARAAAPPPSLDDLRSGISPHRDDAEWLTLALVDCEVLREQAMTRTRTVGFGAAAFEAPDPDSREARECMRTSAELRGLLGAKAKGAPLDVPRETLPAPGPERLAAIRAAIAELQVELAKAAAEGVSH
jgi:GNAT superfamily N-acetyltransferase